MWKGTTDKLRLDVTAGDASIPDEVQDRIKAELFLALPGTYFKVTRNHWVHIVRTTVLFSLILLGTNDPVCNSVLLWQSRTGERQDPHVEHMQFTLHLGGRTKMALTVGRPAPQTCQPRSGSLGTQNTPPASVRSPLHQTSVGSGNETRCSFVLKTQSVIRLSQSISHHHYCCVNWQVVAKSHSGPFIFRANCTFKDIYSIPVKAFDFFFWKDCNLSQSFNLNMWKLLFNNFGQLHWKRVGAFTFP